MNDEEEERFLETVVSATKNAIRMGRWDLAWSGVEIICEGIEDVMRELHELVESLNREDDTDTQRPEENENG